MEACLQNEVDKFNRDSRNNGAALISRMTFCTNGREFTQGGIKYCANNDPKIACPKQFNSCSNLENNCCTLATPCRLGEGDCDGDSDCDGPNLKVSRCLYLVDLRNLVVLLKSVLVIMQVQQQLRKLCQ